MATQAIKVANFSMFQTLLTVGSRSAPWQKDGPDAGKAGHRRGSANVLETDQNTLNLPQDGINAN